MTDKELKRSVLTVTAFASFLTPFMGSSVNLALPSIGDELGVNAVTLNWIVSSYMLTTSVFLLPAGRIGDILGRKKIFTAGLIIFTLTMILLTFTPGIKWLIGVRVLQGVGGAMMFGTNMAILTSVFPPGERGRAMGINVTAVYAGLASGPFLGGLLTRYLGWRSIFAFLVPMGIISLILIRRKMKGEWAEAKGESFDWPGAVIYGTAIAAMIYGFSKLPTVAGWIITAGGTAACSSLHNEGEENGTPAFRPDPDIREQGLCILQPGSPDTLRGHKCHRILSQPLPTVYKGSRAPRCGVRADVLAGDHGAYLHCCRQTVRQP